MPSGRRNNLVRQVGEHLVCAELGRRGFTATPFSGNVPTFDVLATDEQCRTVPIQVKASGGDSWQTDARDWMRLELDPHSGVQHYGGPIPINNRDLIYVCVAIAAPGGRDRRERDRFFVLTKSDIQQACVRSYSGWMEPIGWKRPKKIDCFDCRYKIADINQFEDKWELIAQRLAPDAPLTALG